MLLKSGGYSIRVKPSYIDWGEFRNPTNRVPIPDESYVHIPADKAREYGIERGDVFWASFTNGFPSMRIKAAGNGPYVNGTQYAKQFEGIGCGACKAFTPWYQSCNVEIGDCVEVKFEMPDRVTFSIVK